MTKQRFIIVSNRLPVSVTKQDGELVFTPSSGGLATAMASLNGENGENNSGGEDAATPLWIGWPGISSDELTPAEKAQITRRLRASNCCPVFLSREQVRNFYEGYANDTIWPLFHYFQSFAQYNSEYWAAYQAVNALFKKTVAKHAEADASIWVHDYHLMLLPQLLRTALPRSTIGFFLHIPFPSYEIFRLLPNRVQILEGLLGADLIGFHIYDYARHFLSSALRILGREHSHGSIALGRRVVKVDAFPIGIDYGKFVHSLQEPPVQNELRTLRQHYRGKKIILSVDRLDYSKGIMKRLEAYERFLQRYPAALKQVVLVMVAVPSRTEVETYRELRDDVEKAISRINGAFGTVDWTPISYQFKNLPFEQIVALFAAADVALVTPLRDGMNLVAKEYVAAKQRSPGVLILSEMTGAIDELPEALRINPNDSDSIVQALKTALTMPKARQMQRLASMQRRLSQYTVQRWARDFIEQLARCKQTQAERSSKMLSIKTEPGLRRAYYTARRRLLLLDYDGTLRDFVSSPTTAQAAPSRSLRRLLSRLAAAPGTRLCIVSGRPRDALDGWFGDLPIALAAEHGAWMKYDGEWSQQQVSLHMHKKKILPLLQQYAERTPGARIEQKDFALVWHYRNVPTELAYARNASLRYELHQLLANTDIEVLGGVKIIEIKPRSVRKSTVAGDLMAVFPSDFVLAVGDDYTDEDMFRALPEDAFTVKVGLADTAARFQVSSVKEVLALLTALLDHSKQTASGEAAL